LAIAGRPGLTSLPLGPNFGAVIDVSGSVRTWTQSGSGLHGGAFEASSVGRVK